MSFTHKIIEPELEAIASTGAYGQQIVDAINSVGLCFMDDEYFVHNALTETGVYEKIDAVFRFNVDPQKRRIILNGDLADDLTNRLIIVEQLAHEGIHALQAAQTPELFDRNAPNYTENEVVLERQAHVDSVNITLFVALKIAASAPGDFVTNMYELPMIQAWQNYTSTGGSVVSLALRSLGAGHSSAELLDITGNFLNEEFDKSYTSKEAAISGSSGHGPNPPETTRQNLTTTNNNNDLKGGPK